MDVYYDKYLGALFDDFIDYCIVFVKDHTIKEQLNYLFKVYDFFLKIKENKENDKFYNFIKPLFFEVKSEEIISPKLETYKYKNDKEITNDIILFLRLNSNFNKDKYSNIFESKYEYLNFVRKFSNPNVKENSKEFMSLYFNLLNEEK